VELSGRPGEYQGGGRKKGIVKRGRTEKAAKKKRKAHLRRELPKGWYRVPAEQKQSCGAVRTHSRHPENRRKRWTKKNRAAKKVLQFNKLNKCKPKKREPKKKGFTRRRGCAKDY